MHLASALVLAPDSAAFVAASSVALLAASLEACWDGEVLSASAANLCQRVISQIQIADHLQVANPIRIVMAKYADPSRTSPPRPVDAGVTIFLERVPEGVPVATAWQIGDRRDLETSAVDRVALAARK
jgi:hypothetical protein